MNKKLIMILAVLVGLVFIGVGMIYLMKNAGSLPHFFPGYTLGSTRIHSKHAIAAFVLGVGSFVFAWFVSAPKKTSAPLPPTV